MTLRKKAVLLTTVVLSFVTIVLIVASNFIILSHLDSLEERTVERNVGRANSALQGEVASLQAVVGDWAFWDDTYQFMLNRDRQYIQSNIQSSTFVSLNIDLIAFFNTKGALIFGREFHPLSNQQTILPANIFRTLKFGTTKQGISGIVQLGNGDLVAFSARPILNSNIEGPPRGTLLMGRILNDKEMSKISKATHLNLSLARFQGRQTPNDILWVRNMAVNKDIVVKPINNKHIAGYSLIKDIQGKPVGVIKMVLNREIHIHGVNAMQWYTFYLLISGFIFGAFVYRLLEQVVISRLARLNESLRRITSQKDLSNRVALDGNDELTDVARTMNEMLSTLERSQNELRISEAKLSAMFKNTLNPIFIIDWETKETYGTNQAGLDFLECSLNELSEKKCWEKLNAAIRGNYEEGMFLTESQTIEVNCEVHEKRKTMLINTVPIHTEGKFLIYVIGQDITERKQMEEQLIELSMNDPLTGMYNRIYFERVLQSYDRPEYAPVGLIRCDIDGLKLINDSIGNMSGDDFIIAVAAMLSKAVGHLGLIARTGGDDFTVLVPNSSEAQLESILKTIRTAITEFNRDQSSLPLSLSVGFELGTDLPLEEVLKNAEHNMVREKLHRNLSAKSATVQALMKAMEARDYITEGHAERMEELIVRLGTTIGLSKPRLADLRLLAQFHDIGKVGIPDRILLKPGALSDEERQEMHRHCEIGYRIALSSPDLAPIAQGILKHHEWWDGHGYPLGLKGEEIPLECRLLSIVDAFDAMTNDRPYHKARSVDEAINEIRECAGVQFDPVLAKRFVEMIEED